MKIISWNVNGIRAVHKKGLFVSFIETHKPDIICLQETKAQQHQNEVDLSAYHEYWNSATKAGYSGTAIFSREKPLSVVNGLPIDIALKFKLGEDTYGDPNAEGRVIAAEFKNFFIVTVYTPNSKGDLSRLTLRHTQWDPAFLEYLKQLKKSKPVIFCGDLNVAHTKDDLSNPESNEGEHGFTKEEREGIDSIISAGFIDIFRKFNSGKGFYTWWTPWRNAREKNIGWRIDYFFISTSLLKNVKKALILKDVFGSDHCPVEMDIEI